MSTLSKGERKRAMLALALLTPQPLLLLDEPFEGLDLRQTRDAMRLLRSACGFVDRVFWADTIHEFTRKNTK